MQRAQATPALTPEKGALVLIVFGALGLLAVPGGRGERGPRGAVEGVVMAPRSAERANVAVLLFDQDATTPAELTHTDAHGRFAFRQTFDRFNIVAVPPRDSGFAASWRVGLEPGVHDYVSLSLVPAVPLEVAVTDAGGIPIAGAEVAVYTLGDEGPLAADVALTNAAGRATLLAPEPAGLGARRVGFAAAYAPAPAQGPAAITLLGHP